MKPNQTERRTLVTSIFHQPAGDADDVLKHGFGQVLQNHVLLDLQLFVDGNDVQDENGGNGFTVAGQEAAELGLQQLFTLLEACFLQRSRNTVCNVRSLSITCIQSSSVTIMIATVLPIIKVCKCMYWI